MPAFGNTLSVSRDRRRLERWRQCADDSDLAELVEILGFKLPVPMEVYGPRWNIAPTADVLTIIDRGGVREGAMMRWGLIPARAKPESAFKRPMFDTRSETVAERPMFRSSFNRHRCLVPANGFFEWRREGTGAKTPMWISVAETPVVAFAAISSTWHGPADKAVLMEALKPHEWESMRAIEVDPAVGSTRNDGPHLIRPRASLLKPNTRHIAWRERRPPTRCSHVPMNSDTTRWPWSTATMSPALSSSRKPQTS